MLTATSNKMIFKDQIFISESQELSFLHKSQEGRGPLPADVVYASSPDRCISKLPGPSMEPRRRLLRGLRKCINLGISGLLGGVICAHLDITQLGDAGSVSCRLLPISIFRSRRWCRGHHLPPRFGGFIGHFFSSAETAPLSQFLGGKIFQGGCALPRASPAPAASRGWLLPSTAQPEQGCV